MAKWSTEAIRKTDEKLEGVSHYNLFLFSVEEFKMQIERTGSFAKTCNECKNNKAAIDEILQKIDEAVHVPGSPRREYDRLLSHLGRHMMKAHQFYPANYFRNLYSFIGMVAGMLIGLLLFKLIPALAWEMFSTGTIAGSVAGYFSGVSKDRRIKKTLSP